MAWSDNVDAPLLHQLFYELADGRWWQAYVLAKDGTEARAGARARCPEPDAKLILHSRISADFAPIVVESNITTPRGWDGSPHPSWGDLEATSETGKE